MTRVLADNHSHTYLCGHAEMVRPRILEAVAYEMNFRYYAFCCHNPFLDDSVTPEYRMRFLEFSGFKRLFIEEKEYAEKTYPGMTLLLGMEVDWNPEDPSKTQSFVELCEDYDFLLGSLHYYEGRTISIEPMPFVMNYYNEWEKAFQSGYFQIMSHMDFYKVILGSEWFAKNRDNAAIRNRAYKALDCLHAFNEDREAQALQPIALEVNTGCSQYDGFDMTLPSEDVIKYAIQLEIPISLGSDAHFAAEVGRNMRDVLEMLKRHGLARLCFFVQKKIQYYLLDDALASLRSLNENQIDQVICQAKKSTSWEVD